MTTPSIHYSAELIEFLPDPNTRQVRVSSAEQLRELIHLPVPLIIDIRALDDAERVDHGNMIVFLNESRARIRLLEHQGFIARDLNTANEATPLVRFYDEDGSIFEVPLGETVPREQAFAALQFWMETLCKSDELLWTPED